MVNLNRPDNFALPPLRAELALQPAPVAPDGSPRWTLHDPAGNRFFEISWPAFEMLSRWNFGDAAVVVAAVNAETTLRIELDDIAELLQFLLAHHLTLMASARDTERLLSAAARRRLSAPKWLLKNYLFMRFPLFRPMPFLQRVYPWIRGVYSTRFWWSIAALALLGLYLVSRQWDTFVHTFSAYSGWRGLLGLGVALTFAKVLHELGHALTAYRYGCRVPNMGIALLVMWPVLYTDTNEAWKLSSRRQRLHIGAAGMLAELALAACATLLWSFLPDGPLRAGVFMLATSTWILTLTINASPFTRFDGYFLLSDWLNMPNLHERAFVLGRWWLREKLFGYGDSAPEQLPPSRQRFIVAFALMTWAYRFVLFLSIALLVFHAFFKALGIVLMAVEIGWFLALPIAREIQVWWQRRGELRWRRQTIRSAALFAVLLLALCAPWQNSVRVPAVVGLDLAQRVFLPQAASVEAIDAKIGQDVPAGAVLARLSSPLLNYQLRRAQLQAEELSWQVNQQPFDDDLRALGPALTKQLDAARTAVAALAEQIERLTIRAPFAARVIDIDPEVHAGSILHGGEQLFQLVGSSDMRGDAFVSQEDLARIHVGDRLKFVGDIPEFSATACRVNAIDPVNLTELDEPYIASVYGGRLAAVMRSGGSLRPLETVYRLRFDGCASGFKLRRELAGIAVIRGERVSLLGRGVRYVITLLRREIGIDF